MKSTLRNPTLNKRIIHSGATSLSAAVLLIISALLVVNPSLLAWLRPSARMTPPQKSAQIRTLSFVERVAYQGALEEAYLRHRVWPKENSKSKPPLDAVMSLAKIEKNVEDYLSPTACATPPAGMIDWWPGDGNPDDIQGGNDGQLINGATFASGEVSQAFSFDGVNDYVDVGPNTNLSGTFTIDAWINPADPLSTQFHVIISKGNGSTTGYALYVSQGYLFLFTANASGSTLYLTNDLVIPTPGTWYHVAATYDGNAAAGTRARFYVNGVNVTAQNGQDTGGAPDPDSSHGSIGAFPGSYYYNGLIDELETFNRVLGDTEIADIYNAGSDGKCKPTPTPTPTPTPAATATPSPTPTPEPTATPSPTPQPTATPTPEPTASPTPTPQPTATPTATPEPTPTPAPTCAPTPAGMLSWWPGDGDAHDIQGTNDGTLVNGATFAAGEVAQAFSLDGANDYVDVGSVNLPSTFTIDAWINPSGLSSQPMILSKDDGATSRSYYFEIGGSGQFGAEVLTSAGGTQYLSANGAVVTGAWQHVAMTYDGSAGADQKIKFYVNGVQVAAAHVGSSDNGGTPNVTTVTTKIGIYGNGSSFAFSGLIDEVELFNTVLTQSQIAAIYNAGSAGKCKPTPTPSPTPTPEPTATPTPEPTATPTPSPTSTPTPTPSTTLSINKTADAASVNAGSPIGFTVKLRNNTATTASGLSVTDNLPAGPGINWTLASSNPPGAWSVTGTPPNQALVYNSTTLAGSTTTSAHTVSNTTSPSCGTYNNTASFSSSNGGSGSASSSETVVCPTPTPTASPTPSPSPTPTPTPAPVKVGVTAAPTQINEGQTAVYTVTASSTVSQSITVGYAMSGTATLGTDYTLTGTAGQVTILAGQSSATVNLKARTDHVAEGTETAIMTLQPGSGYQLGNKNQATVSILDSP